MKKDLTELAFILDRSGSMSGLEQDTIGGYNSLIDKQKNEQGEAIITTVLFDDKYEILHDRINLTDVMPITSKEYFVRGSTALLDAIGTTVNNIKNAQLNIADEERPEKVFIAIITDGMENHSSEYSYSKVKAMIETQKELGWEFMFIGANIDAIGEAGKIGIAANRAVKYTADSRGTAVVYSAVSRSVMSMRNEKSVNEDWKREIEEDFWVRNEKKSNEKNGGGILGKLKKLVK